MADTTVVKMKNYSAKEEFEREVQFCRWIFFGLIAVGCMYSASIDEFIAWTWSKYLYPSPIFQHDSFEPVLSSIWFAVNIFFWVLVDFHFPALHKYRIKKGEDNSAWKGRESAFYQEAFWYISPWLVIDYFIKRRRLPLQPPSLARLIQEILLSLFLYDFFFFCGHLTMHKIRFLYEKVHSKHHTIPSVRAADAIRHTVWDGTWDVLCSVISLNLLRAHPYSRALFDIVAITLITEAHSGMDFPWMLHNLIPLPIMAGSRVHYLHHQLGNVNFQKFFTHWDYLAGTLRFEAPASSVQKAAN